ncbi:unnamed protein product [Protopolystoma xenopodis]|uniref:Uncharacterized protein n=1 Tax=Protopolystoma xenopodis TaxID=117903 RepID=A0A3S5AJ32_9PLAT|nr:unnamed protein product [Protopolystoma xenopodis]
MSQLSLFSLFSPRGDHAVIQSALEIYRKSLKFVKQQQYHHRFQPNVLGQLSFTTSLPSPPSLNKPSTHPNLIGLRIHQSCPRLDWFVSFLYAPAYRRGFGPGPAKWPSPLPCRSINMCRRRPEDSGGGVEARVCNRRTEVTEFCPGQQRTDCTVVRLELLLCFSTRQISAFLVLPFARPSAKACLPLKTGPGCLSFVDFLFGTAPIEVLKTIKEAFRVYGRDGCLLSSPLYSNLPSSVKRRFSMSLHSPLIAYPLGYSISEGDFLSNPLTIHSFPSCRPTLPYFAILLLIWPNRTL